MIRTLSLLRAALLSAALLVPGLPARADDFSPTAIFTFAPTGDKAEVADAGEELRATENISVRPNSSSELFLYAKNPSKVEKSYVVEMTAGKTVVSSKVTLPVGKWVRVKFPKPAPAAPAAPAKGAEAAPVPAAPAKPAEPLPAGEELNREQGKFSVTLKLLTEEGKPAKDADGKPYGRVSSVKFIAPNDYVSAAPKLTRSENAEIPSKITAEVSLTADVYGTVKTTLSLPKMSTDSKAIPRKGFYERTLSREPGTKTEAKALLTGSTLAQGEAIRVQIGVDGVDRAFLYKPAPAGVSNDANLVKIEEPAIRVTREVGPGVDDAVTPSSGYPVRVEIDNPFDGALVELHLRPEGAGETAAENEVIRLGGPREEKVYFDVSGPKEGVLVTGSSKDWVKRIDARSLRGATQIVGVLKKESGANSEVIARSNPFSLVIDDTSPEKVEFTKLPERHIKTKPLPVKVIVNDPETQITKVRFFLAAPDEDGKIPPEAKPVLAEPTRDAAVWAAELPFPPEKRGEVFVTAQVVNQAGLTTQKTQKIELVDPPPPAGNIEGKVMLGERPQPNLAIVLKDGEGKEKGITKTDAKGKFKFEKIPPGKYLLTTSKKDSGIGSKAKVEVQVENEKTSKTTLDLTRAAQ